MTNTVTAACAATYHQPRPHDLVGSWALEASGWNGLSDKPLDGSIAEAEDLGLNDLVVAFRKDGTVQVPVDKGIGLQWKVEPGPTHLDTVYFEMIPKVRIMTTKCMMRGFRVVNVKVRQVGLNMSLERGYLGEENLYTIVLYRIDLQDGYDKKRAVSSTVVIKNNLDLTTSSLNFQPTRPVRCC